VQQESMRYQRNKRVNLGEYYRKEKITAAKCDDRLR
jgi:hypothetical protein